MSEIEFWLQVVPSSSSLLAAVRWSCVRYGALWLLLLLAVGVLGGHPEPRPKPRKSLSPRERRRKKRQRNPDGSKRRWRKGQRAK